ncbi:MAG: hypothetical protein HY774_25995 [Acidobacteria bacterium]|nr:hypothetical protein [Acidobacteriota bacterium]
MSDSSTLPVLPTPTVPSGYIWPAAIGRGVIRQIEFDRVISRVDLIGQQGLSDGSGKSDTVIIQAGDWCLKTAGRKHFHDLDDGRTFLVEAARRKLQLGSLLAPNTVLVLQPDDLGGGWVWTISPWMKTLRTMMNQAITTANESVLGQALEIFARAAVRALVLASRQNLVLDVHPSNFALNDDQISFVYIDDDIGHGSLIPAISFCFLRRFDEYAEFGQALAAYLEAIEVAMEMRLEFSDVKTLNLIQDFEHCQVRTKVAEQAQTRIIQILRQRR